MRTPTSRARTFEKSRRGGFTLIELMMVIIVISFIAAIVLPRFDPFIPSRRLKSAARRLSGTITLAYGESVAKNKPYRLYFDPMNDSYWLVELGEKAEEDSGGAIGITLGTNFELLRYQETQSGESEESLPSEPLFAPQKLPQGIHISSVQTREDASSASAGPQYIEFNPLGVADPATVNLVNEKGDTIVLEYDGITGVPSLVFPRSET